MASIKNIPSKIIRVLIKGYRFGVSPFLGENCRFYPSCSAYAENAVVRFGALKGGWLTLTRLLCCHPWHRGGMDEVPDKWSFFPRRNRP